MADASMSDVTVIQVTPSRGKLDLRNRADQQRESSPGETPLSPASHDETSALIERVADMFENRPAVLAGRRGEASSRSLSRNVSGRQTLPVRTRPSTNSSVQRSNSLNQLREYTQAGGLVVEDIESEPAPTVEIVTEFNRGEGLRQSTNHLRQRVQER